MADIDVETSNAIFQTLKEWNTLHNEGGSIDAERAERLTMAIVKEKRGNAANG